MAETADMDDLKRSYDELVESSREIEDALTDELEDMTQQHEQVRVQNEELRVTAASTAQQLTECQSRLRETEVRVAQWAVDRANLEQQLDAMEEQVRRTGANGQELRAKIDITLEDNVLLNTELESTKQKYRDDEERHRTEVAELRCEIERRFSQAGCRDVAVPEFVRRRSPHR
eukprot:FR737164.1.p1 GENE.FR737164.1~~FR737164.1.p1  ORF type:complete len:196 (+),score=25.03 FR737164.1:68-589(+)